MMLPCWSMLIDSRVVKTKLLVLIRHADKDDAMILKKKIENPKTWRAKTTTEVGCPVC